MAFARMMMMMRRRVIMKIFVKQQHVYQQRELSIVRKTSHEHNE